MDRRNMLNWAVGVLFVVGCATADAAEPRHKVLFFTKSNTFEHPVVARNGAELSYAEKLLTEWGAANGFDVTCTKDGRVFDGDLDQYDAFVFMTTGNLLEAGKDEQPPMTVEGKQRLLDAVAGGKGFVGIHCGSDTFHSEGVRFGNNPKLNPYIAMLGGEFIRHGVQQEARQVVASPDFPGLKDVGDSFRLMEEWYSLKNFSPDLRVILAQDTQGMTGSDYERPPYPSTWARKHDQGRVFYTSLGHREDVWANPIFKNLLLGGLGWVCGDTETDLTPNIEQITPGASVMPPEPPPKPPAADATTPAPTAPPATPVAPPPM